MTVPILGIDVSKDTLHLALVKGESRPQKKTVTNDATGFAQLQQWLSDQQVGQLHACLEATNTYGQAIATELYQQGHRVSIVNPARVQGFAQGELSRTKNDSADAATIARFCAAMQPKTWHPLTPEADELQQLTRRLEMLQRMIGQEKNRLGTATVTLQEEIEAHIEFMQEQFTKLEHKIQQHIEKYESLNQALELLVSIKGISTRSGSQILAEISRWKEFRSARQLAAYAGLTPQEKQSGSSVHGKTRLCKIGNAHLRRALYFPALTSLRWSPPIQAWAEQLRAKGKTKMQVVGAVMHKLVRIIYGVLKSGKPFDPALLMPNP
ncbi:MAG: IS110 family transposase [Alkalinema sp. CACIAM 70d]|nr:MAG: IS110 family transposase [Alkalinema sp. CACIAM 70d]